MITRLIARGQKLARILAVPLWRRALLDHGVAAGVEHCVVLRQLGEVRSIVDIGANQGQFALAVRHQFPEASILSFEPLPAPVAAYRAVFANDQKTTLHEAAIGPEPGQTVMHLSVRHDSSSLLPISAAQNAHFPGTGPAGTTLVTVGPLPDYIAPAEIEPPALLKLDVQGFELQALAASESLLPLFSWVYAECSFIELYDGQALADEVVAWLRQRGLALSGVYNLVGDNAGRPIQVDALFARIRQPSTSLGLGDNGQGR